MKCEGQTNLQRGTADAAELGGDRHMHQLQALCTYFHRTAPNFCAMPLCNLCTGLGIDICRELSLDLSQGLLLAQQFIGESKRTSFS